MPVRNVGNKPPVSLLYRESVILDVSQAYESPWPVTGIVKVKLSPLQAVEAYRVVRC
jgi:hypothetical protein